MISFDHEEGLGACAGDDGSHDMSRRNVTAERTRDQERSTRAAKSAKGQQGFTQRPNWLFRTSFSPTVREVYTVLLSHAWGDKISVFPSVSTIAAEARIGARSVGQALRVLERSGVISIERRWQDERRTIPTSNTYTLHKLSTSQIKAVCALTKNEIKAMTAGPGDLPDHAAAAAVPQNLQDPSRRNCSTPPASDADEEDELLEPDKSEPNETGLDGTSAYGDSAQSVPAAETFVGTGTVQPLESTDYSQPLADTNQECDAVTLANHLERLRASKSKVAWTATKRSQNLKTARLLLACDGCSLAEVTELLNWAYRDSYWSNRIVSLYALRDSYGSVLEDSASRKPRTRRADTRILPLSTIKYRPRHSDGFTSLSIVTTMSGTAEEKAREKARVAEERAMDADPEYRRIWEEVAASGEFDVRQRPDLVHVATEKRWKSAIPTDLQEAP